MKVIIAGASTVGRRLVDRLSYRFWDIELIDPDPDVVDNMEDLPVRVHTGDARQPEVQRKAGVTGSTMFFALTGSDELNLEIARQAMVNGAKRVVALCHDPSSISRFQEEGIKVIQPEELTADVLDELIRSPSLWGALSLSGGVAEVVEASVLPGSPAVGQTIEHLRLPDLRVAGLIRSGTMMDLEDVEGLQVGDHLTLIGPPEVVRASVHYLAGGEQLFPSLYGNTILSLMNSEESLEFSFEYALQMAALANAELTVLIVEQDPEKKQSLKRRTQQKADDRGIPLSFLESPENLARATSEAVERIGASMLVLDRNEVGWLESLLGRDPLQEMISELSGMIFKVQNPPTDRNFDRVGIITDGSVFSEEAASTGVELAFLMDLPVRVFTVTPARELAREEQMERAEHSLKHVEEMAQLWGVHCETHVLEGDPLTVIPKAFEELTDPLAVFGVSRASADDAKREGLFKPQVFHRLVSTFQQSALIVK